MAQKLVYTYQNSNSILQAAVQEIQIFPNLPVLKVGINVKLELVKLVFSIVENLVLIKEI